MVNDLDQDLTSHDCLKVPRWETKNDHVIFGRFRLKRMKQFNPVSIKYFRIQMNLQHVGNAFLNEKMFSSSYICKKAGFDVVECYNQFVFQFGILKSSPFYYADVLLAYSEHPYRYRLQTYSWNFSPTALSNFTYSYWSNSVLMIRTIFLSKCGL